MRSFSRSHLCSFGYTFVFDRPLALAFGKCGVTLLFAFLFKRMKRKGILLFIAKVRAVLIVASGFIPKLDAADIRLGSPVPQPDGSMTVNVTGIVPGSVAVQGSTDLRTWTDLQTLSLQGSANFREPQASETAFRFFRVKNQSPPPALPDLSASVNTVFPAGESFNSVQFAPNGNLGFIFLEKFGSYPSGTPRRKLVRRKNFGWWLLVPNRVHPG